MKRNSSQKKEASPSKVIVQGNLLGQSNSASSKYLDVEINLAFGPTTAVNLTEIYWVKVIHKIPSI